ncbi:MAG TPA: MFS transporter [Terriglobales bacterium]|nr:MFS transporter [Terriglobales bacterium]
MTQRKGTPGSSLFAATLGFAAGFAAVALFGPTASRFQQVMHLSPIMVGFLVSAPALSGSLLRIPFSAWVDTTGGRKPFLVLLTLSLLGMAGLLGVIAALYPDHLSHNLYPLLLLLGILCGCGIATFSVGISQVSYWFPQAKQGRALAIYGGVGNLAPGLFSFLLPVALASLGLAKSYGAWFLFLLSGTILYALLGRNAPFFQLLQQGVNPDEARRLARASGQSLFPAGSLVQSLKVSARAWKTWALVWVYFTTFGGFIALTAWFPTYWQSYFGVSAVKAGLLTGLYSVLTSAIRIGGGMLSDRLREGGENTAILALLIMANGAIIMTSATQLELALPGEILLAIGMGVCNAAVFKLVPQEVPQAVGGAVGWVGGLGALGGFVIPPVLGFAVHDLGQRGYAIGFIVFVFLAMFGLGVVWVLKYTREEAVPPASTTVSAESQIHEELHRTR